MLSPRCAVPGSSPRSRGARSRRDVHDARRRTCRASPPHPALPAADARRRELSALHSLGDHLEPAYRRLRSGAKIVDRRGVDDVELAAARSAQRGKMCCAAACTAEIAGERTYICTAAADDGDVQLVVGVRRDLPLVHRDGRRGEHDAGTGAGRAICWCALHLLCRKLRRNLRYDAGERWDRRQNGVTGRKRCCANHVAGRITGICLLAETDRRVVNLGLVVDEGGEACGATEQEDEQSSGERVEGAEVADAAFAVYAARDVDDVMRGDSSWFVDEQQTRYVAVVTVHG